MIAQKIMLPVAIVRELSRPHLKMAMARAMRDMIAAKGQAQAITMNWAKAS